MNRVIIQELTKMGYKVKEHTSIKNGVKMKGICFVEKNVCPIIYTDEIIRDCASLQDGINRVLAIYKNAGSVKFDKDSLMSPKFIMKNAYIGLQKISSENIIKCKTEFNGIEKYLYVRIDDNSTFKLTKNLIDTLCIHEDEIWKMAEKNTFSETKIVSMSWMLSQMMGVEIEETFHAQYIITNNSQFRGASAILDKSALKEFARKLNVHKLIVLPSSIHEMIIMPTYDWDSMEELSSIVKEINQERVLPEERLTDVAYIIEI